MKPKCYDLYCGLGGWAEGFLSEGYDCIGYDIEKHDYGTGTYPGTLILCDVRSIHGSQLKDAAVIVASPPCQEPSYRAMPWKQGEGPERNRTAAQLHRAFQCVFQDSARGKRSGRALHSADCGECARGGKMGRLGTLALRELLPMGRCACAHAANIQGVQSSGLSIRRARFISICRCCRR